MKFNILFVVLTLIVIIAVIMLAPNLVTAMIIVSLLANFMALCTHFGKMSVKIQPETKDKEEEDKLRINDMLAVEDEKPVPMYSPEYQMWHELHRSYGPHYGAGDSQLEPGVRPGARVYKTPAEAGTAVDINLALLGQHRARDKRCLDGAYVKDAKYYQFHHADELDQEEAKPWWGRGEW